jgi:transposase InsO family protein
VAGLFPRKTAGNAVALLTGVRAAMPFPIQRIQTDRGQEFFAYRVQDQLRAWRIKFRPTRPRSPHLNGKVERVQRTALDEFWADVDPADPALPEQFAAWQRFYCHASQHPSRYVVENGRASWPGGDPAGWFGFLLA